MFQAVSESHTICTVLCTPAGDVKAPFLEYSEVHPSQMCQVRVASCRIVGSESEFSQDAVAVRTGPTGQYWGNWFRWSCPCNPCHLFEWKHTWNQKKFPMHCLVLIFVLGWWNSIEFNSHLMLRSITFNCHQKTLIRSNKRSCWRMSLLQCWKNCCMFSFHEQPILISMDTSYAGRGLQACLEYFTWVFLQR